MKSNKQDHHANPKALPRGRVVSQTVKAPKIKGFPPYGLGRKVKPGQDNI